MYLSMAMSVSLCVSEPIETQLRWFSIKQQKYCITAHINVKRQYNLHTFRNLKNELKDQIK